MNFYKKKGYWTDNFDKINSEIVEDEPNPLDQGTPSYDIEHLKKQIELLQKQLESKTESKTEPKQEPNFDHLYDENTPPKTTLQKSITAKKLSSVKLRDEINESNHQINMDKNRFKLKTMKIKHQPQYLTSSLFD